MAYRKFGRDSSARKAMLRDVVTALFDKERIETTEAKAKEVSGLADEMITLAKRGDLHARRQAYRVLNDHALVKRLFDEIGPVFAGVPGGYTRILKLAMPRKGDNAPMAFIELTHSAEAVATEAPKAAEEAPAKPKRTRKPKAEEAGAVTEEAEAN